jgi:hypothetical protein
MGQIVFQATAGGQTALVGPNPSSNFSLNVPAVNGNLVTTGDTSTVTSTMLATNVYTAPGAIGSGTANSGAFTSLSASSTVSGTGFSNYLASPPAIGGTAAAAGTFTTLTLGGNTQNQQIGQGNASIMKNRIINGAMVIAQYSTGTSTNTGFQTVDRWAYSTSQIGKVTYGQNYGGVTPPPGFTNYFGLAVTTTATLGATDYFQFYQPIEGYNVADLAWGTANAKTITLSFWVYASVTGNYGAALRNGNDTRSYPFLFTVSSANTWTQISVTIPGDTSGTWATNNTRGMFLGFSLATGTTYSGTANTWSSNLYGSVTGATSIIGTSGATFYITGVQLEVGSSATGYEYRQYQQELALCQRYAYKTTSTNSVYGSYMVGATDGVNNIVGAFNLPVTMRGTVSLTTTGTATDYAVYGPNSVVNVCNLVPVITLNGNSNTQIGLVFQTNALLGGSGKAGVGMANTTNGYLLFTAEL